MDIQRRIKALSIEEYPDICFSASIGGIYGPGNTAELLQTADEQMYRAKREGCGNAITIPFADDLISSSIMMRGPAYEK